MDLLKSKTEDLFRLCEKYSSARFSQFLDGGEIADIKRTVKFPYGYNTMFFGGHDDCERKIFGVFPEWEEPSADAFPISVIKISSSYKELSHRDYLGSILSLGIERNKIGDIIVDGKTAYVFAEDSIREYISGNIVKIGNQGVKTQMAKNFPLPEKRFEEIETVCASQRIDAVVSALTRTSRQTAQKLIEAGYVKLDYRVSDKASQNVPDGGILSVRGYGRFIFEGAGSMTRKGRIHITAKRFI